MGCLSFYLERCRQVKCVENCLVSIHLLRSTGAEHTEKA